LRFCSITVSTDCSVNLPRELWVKNLNFYDDLPVCPKSLSVECWQFATCTPQCAGLAWLHAPTNVGSDRISIA
jgi:hypothetical protein